MNPLEQLTLFWLVVQPLRKGSLAAFYRAMDPLLKHIEHWKQKVALVLEELDRADLIGRTRDSLRLKAAGQGKALELLELDDAPKIGWVALKVGVVVPRLLELSRGGSKAHFTPDELSTAVIRRWIDGASAGPQGRGANDESQHGRGRAPRLRADPAGSRAPLTKLPDDLATFARQVIAAAEASKTGWFGDNKVFISHVWRQMREPGGDMDAFKARLVDAHRAALLTLSRADLVGAMDPKDVDESETHYLSATFHFVRLPDRSR